MEMGMLSGASISFAPPFRLLGADSADNRWLCLRDGVQPHIRKIGEPYGSRLGKVRCIVEHGCAWLLANKRLD